MLGCHNTEHLGLIVGVIIGFILLYVAIHFGQKIKKKYLRDKKLRQAHLDNCEVCRNHRDQFVGKNG